MKYMCQSSSPTFLVKLFELERPMCWRIKSKNLYSHSGLSSLKYSLVVWFNPLSTSCKSCWSQRPKKSKMSPSHQLRKEILRRHQSSSFCLCFFFNDSLLWFKHITLITLVLIHSHTSTLPFWRLIHYNIPYHVAWNEMLFMNLLLYISYPQPISRTLSFSFNHLIHIL